MTTRIEFDGWFSAGLRDAWSPIPRFRLLDDAGDSLGIVIVLLTRTAEQLLLNQLGLEWERDRHQQPVVRAVLRHGVHEIERGLQQGTLPPQNARTAAEISINTEELPRLASLAGEKECEYQAAEGRDLYCRAASDTDTAPKWVIGNRLAAPTSRPICKACALPDTDYLCSNFSHAEVSRVPVMGPYSRQLDGGLCQKGRDEILTRPGECRPGGNECWERRVDTAVVLEVPLSPPLQLPEAVDHLDMAWRLLFGRDRRLFRPGGVADVAALMLPCASREEFESRLSDLADLVKRLEVGDEYLSEASRAIEKSHTLERMKAALLERVAEEDTDEVENAIRVLQAVSRIRVGQQHSAAQQKTIESFKVLGLRYPVADWDETWSKVRSAAADAFLRLAHIVRRLEPRGPVTPPAP